MIRALPALLLLVACGSERPPFAELPLRDTLQAEARALSQLSDEERAVLRDRFIHALRDADDDSAVVTDNPWARFDERREREGKDAAVSVALEDDGRVHTTRDEFGEGAGSLMLETRDDPKTSGHIAAALAGRAGGWIGRFIGARTLVRADNAPFAVATDATAVYVNPSWLVVMAEPVVGVEIVRPTRQSAVTVATVTSIDACIQQVRDACEPCETDASMCDEMRVLRDFESTQAECVAARATTGNTARNICAALALGRADVRQCIERNEPGCLEGSDPAFTAFYETFYGQQICQRLLQRCAADTRFVQQITCDVCTSSCDTSCRNACRGPSFNCNPSCNTGTSNCSTPSCSGSLCAQTSEPPPVLPIGFALLPLFFFAWVARKK